MYWIDFAAKLTAETHRAFGLSATYYAGGEGAGHPVTVVQVPADEDLEWSGGRVAARGERIELRAAEVAAPQAGDEIEVTEGADAGRRWRIKGQPKRDAEGSAWLCDVTEIGA
mgnify:CR=1 FL=1